MTGVLRRRRGALDERGFVTAELAAVLPTVVAVIALAVWAVGTVGLKVRAVDAANSAALAAARGEDPYLVAQPYLPDGAEVTIDDDQETVRARVTVTARPLGVLTPSMEVGAEAAAMKEPGWVE